MTMYLLTSSDYSAVLGYAECASGYDQRAHYAPQVTAYNTDRTQVFTRKGLTSAERRAHELGMRLVATGYFGLDNSRPEHMSAPAYAVAEAERRGWPIPPRVTPSARSTRKAGAA